MTDRKRSVCDPSSGASLTAKRSLLSKKVDSVAESVGRRSADKTIFCPHCDSFLSSKTFRKHKALYFDFSKAIWTKIGEEDNEDDVLSTSTVDENFEAPGLPLEESDTHMNSSDESGPYEQDITEDSNCLPLQQEDESETEEVWENDDAEEQLNEDLHPDLPEQAKGSDQSVDSLVSWLVLFLLRLQSKYYIPDVAIACLVKFLYAFFVIVGLHSEYVANMARQFPRSLYCLRKYSSLDVAFSRFVVCRKCYSVYDMSNCTDKHLSKNGTKFLSTATKFMSIAMASWDEDIFGSSPTFLPRLFVNPADATLRPVRIDYFLKLSYVLSDIVYTQLFVRVSWFQPHPSRFSIEKPAQVWRKNAFEPEGLHSYIPLHLLSQRCIHTVLDIDGENCLVVVPLVE